MNEIPVSSSPPPAPNESQARTWNMLCHLSALAGLVIPFGNLLGPLLIWQIKKHQFPSVEAHGKAALNFQLTVLIAAVVGGVLAFVLSFVCIGYLLFPVVVLIGLAGLVFAIIAGVQANDGRDYRYPYSLTLIQRRGARITSSRDQAKVFHESVRDCNRLCSRRCGGLLSPKAAR
jgi:uncharacterized protein